MSISEVMGWTLMPCHFQKAQKVICSPMGSSKRYQRSYISIYWTSPFVTNLIFWPILSKFIKKTSKFHQQIDFRFSLLIQMAPMEISWLPNSVLSTVPRSAYLFDCLSTSCNVSYLFKNSISGFLYIKMFPINPYCVYVVNFAVLLLFFLKFSAFCRRVWKFIHMRCMKKEL